VEKRIRAKASRQTGTGECSVHRLPEHAESLLKGFFAANGVSEGTKESYRKAMLSYVRVIDAPLEEACNQSLTRWYTTLNREGYEPGTIFMYGIKLRALYGWGLRQRGYSKDEARSRAVGLFEAVPLQRLRKEAGKRNKLRDKLVTSREFSLMLRAADHPRTRALLAMLYESAARPDELLGLRIRDVDFQKRYAQIRVDGKTGERTIPLMRSIPKERVETETDEIISRVMKHPLVQEIVRKAVKELLAKGALRVEARPTEASA